MDEGTLRSFNLCLLESVGVKKLEHLAYYVNYFSQCRNDVELV